MKNQPIQPIDARLKPIISNCLLVILPLIFCAFYTPKAQASGWLGDHNAAVRIIGSHQYDGTLYAGIEINLGSNWKTYWRSPGVGGIAPEVLDIGSNNLANISMAYPAPRRYEAPYGTYFAYTNNVVFPLAITPIDPAKPVMLKLSFRYGACLDVCVPHDVELQHEMPAGISLYNSAIAKALTLTNRPLPKNEQADIKAKLTSSQDRTKHYQLDITVKHSQKLGQLVDVLVESPDTRLIKSNQLTEQTDNLSHYRQAIQFNADHQYDHDMVTLVLTLIYEKDAKRLPYETVIRINKSA